MLNPLFVALGPLFPVCVQSEAAITSRYKCADTALNAEQYWGLLDSESWEWATMTACQSQRRQSRINNSSSAIPPTTAKGMYFRMRACRKQVIILTEENTRVSQPQSC